MRSTLLELAERVEKLEGPDAKVNADILRALGWTERGWAAFTPEGHRAMMIPDYLGSIDAAMTLVPVGDGIGFQVGCGAGMQANAGVWAVSTNAADLLDKDFPCPMWQASANAATPALALCAASLKAIAAMEVANG